LQLILYWLRALQTWLVSTGTTCVCECGQQSASEPAGRQSCYLMPWLSVSHVFCLFVLHSAFSNASILGKFTASEGRVRPDLQSACLEQLEMQGC
jgi:hypothetical protein